MARRARPDLITLDLMMPGMTGWDALKALKDDDALRDVPVVVVSIVAGEGRGRLLGAVDLLTKPVERHDLLRVLWRNLVRRGEGRVLVVDDDPDARALVRDALEDAGLEVRCEENGYDALRAVNEEAPDAVVLDLMMPVMDGFEFLEKLRENPYHQGLPVIVLTAKELSRREREELQEKASSVLAKGPSMDRRLESVLGAFLPLDAE
jgi:CheY-like chemotaxis protein